MNNYQLNYKDKQLDLSQARIMGIVNMTPDSFSQVGRYQDLEQALLHAQQLVSEGADIIDVGGEPTNPSLHPVVPLDMELERVVPFVRELSQRVDVPISVDTSKPEVMEAVIEAGAFMINDVRALTEEGALEVVAKADIPVCLMHMRYPHGIPEAAQIDANEDIVATVSGYLHERIDRCSEAGIKQDKIVIDPGVGGGNFGKTSEQSYSLIKHIKEFNKLEAPILLGASRKSFIGDVLQLPAEQRLHGSVATAVYAACNGAHIIRVHDVAATKQALAVATAIEQAK